MSRCGMCSVVAVGGSQLHSSGRGASASSSWGWASGSAYAVGVVSSNPLCVRM